MIWDVRPLQVGLCTLGERHLLGDAYSDDDRVDFALYSFLLRGPDGRCLLVDLGPKTLPFVNRMFRRYGFFRGGDSDTPGPDDIVQREGNVFAHLQRLGIAPADIDAVIFTHLHADHHGMDTPDVVGAPGDLPRATFHVSATGWADNLARRRDDAWGGYVDFKFSDFIAECLAAGRAAAADNEEVAPGVRTVYLGGHSVCSQAVRVDTKAGPVVIASDEIYRYDLLATGVMARLFVTPERWRDAVGRLAAMATEEGAALVPVHDPAVDLLVREAGDGWVEAARKLSLCAARAYREKEAAA